MIAPERFVARSSDRESWLSARSEGVTATMAAKAFTPAGFQEVIRDIDNPREIPPNAYMEWGTRREPHIAQVVKERFGIMPNDWLISHDNGLRRWQMATPDGLSLDHETIAEIKTTGKGFNGAVPAHYMRQMQWQMYVCGEQVQKCLFAWELRLEGPEGFQPGFDINTQWVERDESLIRDLIAVAEQVQSHNVYRTWDAMDQLNNEFGEM